MPCVQSRALCRKSWTQSLAQQSPWHDITQTQQTQTCPGSEYVTVHSVHARHHSSHHKSFLLLRSRLPVRIITDRDVQRILERQGQTFLKGPFRNVTECCILLNAAFSYDMESARGHLNLFYQCKKKSFMVWRGHFLQTDKRAGDHAPFYVYVGWSQRRDSAGLRACSSSSTLEIGCAERDSLNKPEQNIIWIWERNYNACLIKNNIYF